MSSPPVARLLRWVALAGVLGVVTGVAWYLLAPTPAFVLRARGVGYAKDLPGEYVAMDGWFAVCGLVAGVVVAVAVLLRHGAAGLTAWLVARTAALGLIGSLVAWWTGRLLGPAEEEPPGARVVGTVFHGALELTARGVLLIWPVTTLAILTFAVAWSSRELPATEAASVRGDGDLAGLDRG